MNDAHTARPAIGSGDQWGTQALPRHTKPGVTDGLEKPPTFPCARVKGLDVTVGTCASCYRASPKARVRGGKLDLCGLTPQNRGLDCPVGAAHA